MVAIRLIDQCSVVFQKKKKMCECIVSCFTSVSNNWTCCPLIGNMRSCTKSGPFVQQMDYFLQDCYCTLFKVPRMWSLNRFELVDNVGQNRHLNLKCPKLGPFTLPKISNKDVNNKYYWQHKLCLNVWTEETEMHSSGSEFQSDVVCGTKEYKFCMGKRNNKWQMIDSTAEWLLTETKCIIREVA